MSDGIASLEAEGRQRGVTVVGARTRQLVRSIYEISVAPTIIAVLGTLVDKCKGKVHPGPIHNAAVCSDERCLLEEHGYVSWEMLSKASQV